MLRGGELMNVKYGIGSPYVCCLGTCMQLAPCLSQTEFRSLVQFHILLTLEVLLTT
jgi:hypothetical protein